MSSNNGRRTNLESEWSTNPRWAGIRRPYSASDVERLRGSIPIEHTLARLGAERLWNLLHSEPYTAALGALTGNQAVQQVSAGLPAIYVSGWQVAADANDASETYPDQSLYPADSVPHLVRRINRALVRADQIHHAEGRTGTYWLAPLVADAEAGFGGNLNAFELMKAMIEAGAAGVHFEDQLSSAKKCGHLGGKVLVPTSEAIHKLVAARLAADVMGVPTLIIARTDADSATLLTSRIDPRDAEFVIPGECTSEGFFRVRSGVQAAIARGLWYAPYADLLWCETSKPDLGKRASLPKASTPSSPEKCWRTTARLPSIGGRIWTIQRELAAMGYKFQFITLAGFHALNLSMFELARGFKKRGMTAYCRLQDEEFRSEHEHGYDAVQHQQFVGTGYFDSVQHAIMSGNASTVALEGSTEAAQFNGRKRGQHAAKEPRAPAPERVPRVRRSIRLDRAIRS